MTNELRDRVVVYISTPYKKSEEMPADFKNKLDISRESGTVSGTLEKIYIEYDCPNDTPYEKRTELKGLVGDSYADKFDSVIICGVAEIMDGPTSYTIGQKLSDHVSFTRMGGFWKIPLNTGNE